MNSASLWFCREDWLSFPCLSSGPWLPPTLLSHQCVSSTFRNCWRSAPATPLPCHSLCCYVFLFLFSYLSQVSEGRRNNHLSSDQSLEPLICLPTLWISKGICWFIFATTLWVRHMLLNGEAFVLLRSLMCLCMQIGIRGWEKPNSFLLWSKTICSFHSSWEREDKGSDGRKEERKLVTYHDGNPSPRLPISQRDSKLTECLLWWNFLGKPVKMLSSVTGADGDKTETCTDHRNLRQEAMRAWVPGICRNWVEGLDFPSCGIGKTLR